MSAPDRGKKRKPRFAVGDRAYCVLCKRTMTVTAIHFWEGEPLFGMDGEDPSKEGEGHTSRELRKARRKVTRYNTPAKRLAHAESQRRYKLRHPQRVRSAEKKWLDAPENRRQKTIYNRTWIFKRRAEGVDYPNDS